MEIPLPPEFDDAYLQKCRDSNDYIPILFDWYKYVGILANFYASIKLESPIVKKITPIYYSVLIGLLNRCSRLMLANVTLSNQGLFGETTAILDRCIFETTVKLIWLCKNTNSNYFDQFIADGLKTEIKFKDEILKNIKLRKNNSLPIEKRMLESINNYITVSRLTENQIISLNKLPDLASMINDIGYDNLAYIVGQKIGSHHVHGTWVSLWYHYLKEYDGVIGPRDHDCPTHINQYGYISLMVIKSILAFITYIISNEQYINQMSSILIFVEDEITKIYLEAIGEDYK